MISFKYPNRGKKMFVQETAYREKVFFLSFKIEDDGKGSRRIRAGENLKLLKAILPIWNIRYPAIRRDDFLSIPYICFIFAACCRQVLVKYQTSVNFRATRVPRNSAFTSPASRTSPISSIYLTCNAENGSPISAQRRLTTFFHFRAAIRILESSEIYIRSLFSPASIRFFVDYVLSSSFFFVFALS